MEISFELLTDLLLSVEWLKASYHRECTPYKDEPIETVALLPSIHQKYEKNVLWCGYLSNILAMDSNLRQGRSFMALGTDEEFELLIQKNDCNCLFFTHIVGLPSVFNEAARVIQKLNEWNTKMDLAIAQQEGLQKLVDLTEPLVDNPILLWNTSFEIKAYSKNIPIDRPQIQRVLREGRFSGDDIRLFIEMNYLQNSDHYNELTLVNPPNWVNAPFAIKLFKEGFKPLISMVQYFFNSNPSPAKIELLTKFANKIEAYINRYFKTGRKEKSYLYEAFITDLIDGRLYEKDDIISFFSAINIPFEGKYRVIQIKFEKHSHSLSSYAKAKCKLIFPRTKVIIYNDSLIIMVREDCLKKDAESREYLCSSLTQLLDSCDAYCGISNIVPDLTYIRSAYLQTEAAMRVGKDINANRRIWYYKETYFHDLLNCYSQHSGIDIRHLYYRSLDDLIEYDESTGNDNLRLLDIYLNRDRNITQTAKEMNLHRNSVIYRLERIEQILNCSLNDPQTRFNLLISLKILDYLKTKGQKQRGPVSNAGVSVMNNNEDNGETDIKL